MPNENNPTNNLKAYIEIKAGALRRPNGAWLARYETRLTGRLDRRLKQQMRWVMANTKDLGFFEPSKGLNILEKKTYYNDIDNLVNSIPYNTDIVDSIVATVKPTYKKGVTKGIKELEMGKYGVTFDLVNDQAVEYLENLRTLQLSNFRGAINRQTKDKIRKILVESAETGRSYTETAKLIQAQGKEGVFSRSRAELIATNQVGRAYGQGNYDIVQAFSTETNSIVQKYWQTVGDDRVTPECAENEDQGWIGFTEAWPSGDEVAPRQSNPRCRCATTFRTVDKQGNPT